MSSLSFFQLSASYTHLSTPRAPPANAVLVGARAPLLRLRADRGLQSDGLPNLRHQAFDGVAGGTLPTSTTGCSLVSAESARGIGQCLPPCPSQTINDCSGFCVLGWTLSGSLPSEAKNDRAAWADKIGEAFAEDSMEFGPGRVFETDLHREHATEVRLVAMGREFALAPHQRGGRGRSRPPTLLIS